MTAKATYDGYGTRGWLTRVEPVITLKPFLCETPSPRHNPRLRSWLHHNIHKILLLAKPSKQCKKISLLCIVLWCCSSLNSLRLIPIFVGTSQISHTLSANDDPLQASSSINETFWCQHVGLPCLQTEMIDMMEQSLFSARGYAGHATTRGRGLRKSWIRRIGCLVVCLRALS